MRWEAEGVGRDEHPASSSPGMDPHPPCSTAAGTEPTWPSPSGRLHHTHCRCSPRDLGVMRSPLSLSPLSQRLCSRSGAASSCTLQAGTAALAWIFNANGLALSAPLPSAWMQPGWRAGGQGQHVPIVPLSHTLSPPGAGDKQGTGRGDSSSPGDVLQSRRTFSTPH